MRTDKIISIYQLDGEQREIAEVIGLEAYKKLVEHYGGSYIYVTKTETMVRDERNNEIRQKFNGSNYRELAKEYNLTENRVRAIIRKKSNDC